MPTYLAAGEVDHSSYDALLKEHIRDGLVDYTAIKDDLPRLVGYLEMLGDSSSTGYDSWNREEKMAFWINAYNAVTVYAIVINYPIEPGGIISRRRFPENSIRKIDDFWDTVII